MRTGGNRSDKGELSQYAGDFASATKKLFPQGENEPMRGENGSGAGEYGSGRGKSGSGGGEIDRCGGKSSQWTGKMGQGVVFSKSAAKNSFPHRKAKPVRG